MTLPTTRPAILLAGVLLCAAGALPIPLAEADEIGAKPVTLEVKGKPLREVLAELSRQSGLKTEWWGSGEPPVVDLSVRQVSILEAVALLCQAHGWGISLSGDMEKMGTLQIDATQTRLPVLSYAASGPILLVWYGLGTIDDFDFSVNPPAIKPFTQYRMGLLVDPLSHANVLDRGAQKMARDVPLTLTLPDGKTLTLRSEHGSNIGPQMRWVFSPRPELAGLTGPLSVSLPYEMPARLHTMEIPFVSGKTDCEGVRIDLEAVAPAVKKERDPKDYFKEIDLRVFGGKLHLIHTSALGLEEVRPYERKREPTEDEARRLKALEGGMGALEAHAFFLVMKDGSALEGPMHKTQGISSPWHGYRFDLKFTSTDLKVEAKVLRLSFVTGIEKKEASFTIEGAVFAKP